jgi:hypothetical protein
MKTCPCCGQSLPPKIVVNGPVRQRIVDILASRPAGITADELTGLVYAEDPNGGPENHSIRVHIWHLNRFLARQCYQIKSTRGPAARYQLINTYDPEDDFTKSIEWSYKHIRERKANGGKGWRKP